MDTLATEKMFAEFNQERREVSLGDKTDTNNDPRAYTTRKRNIRKGWEALKANLTESTTFYDAIKLLDEFGLRCHSYCAMD